MADNTKMDEMQALVSKLNAASDAYYNGRGELMTDYEWDAGFDRLKTLERETGVVLEDSPTHNVSADDVAGQRSLMSSPHCLWRRRRKSLTWLNGPTTDRYGCPGNLTV